VNDALIVSLLSVLPRNALARAMGASARTRLSRAATRAFVAGYGVALDEALVPESGFDSLDALFTRRLKPGARPVDDAPDALVSPVDGVLSRWAPAVERRLDVAPGRSLDLGALLGEPPAGAVDVAVLYLSPKDYHRVHVPCDGRLQGWAYHPGTLWPVFPGAVRRVDGLFERNERVLVRLATPAGPVHVVLVGAFGVGRIALEHADIVSNAGLGPATGALAADVRRGGPLGVFHLGSTVILALPAGAWAPTVGEGAVVRMGRCIGRREGR
jgi:phosphatidylserine decarboxylase